jgi:hypothetical protein
MKIVFCNPENLSCPSESGPFTTPTIPSLGLWLLGKFSTMFSIKKRDYLPNANEQTHQCRKI